MVPQVVRIHGGIAPPRAVGLGSGSESGGATMTGVDGTCVVGVTNNYVILGRHWFRLAFGFGFGFGDVSPLLFQ
jgi:hypothetical protein